MFDALAPVSSAPKSLHQLACDCEALLFVSREPLSLDELARLTASPKNSVEKALKQIQRLFRHRGIQIEVKATGWQFVPAARSKAVIKAYHETPCVLSDEALETLAVIAYLQPIDEDGVTEVRYQDTTYALETLFYAGLIERTTDSGGRQTLSTTECFLDNANLLSIDALPPIDLDSAASSSA